MMREGIKEKFRDKERLMLMQEHLSMSASQPASHVSEFKSRIEERGAASFKI
jgi:hypothetical protein